MRADFALVDQRFFRFMHEFDRVFHGQDVAHLVFVDVVHHRRQRGRFAGTGRAGHQHHAAREFGDVLEDRRAFEVFQRQYLGRNGTHYRARAAILDEGVDAETRQIRHFEREVDFLVFFVVFALPVVHDVVHHGVDFLVLHRGQIDAAHIAVHADHRWQACRKVQVGGLVLHAEGEQFGDIHI